MKKEEWEINTFYYIFLIIGMLAFSQQGYAQRSSQSQRPLNIGFKVGLNALSSTGFEACSSDIALRNVSHTNQYGYNANGFFRINLDHFFMQPEFEWNYYKQSFSFSVPTGGENGWSTPYDFSLQSQAFSINILVGYSIIKNGVFLFNAYAGPSFKYKYYSRFEYLDNVYRNHEPEYNPYGVLGLSFSISKFFVDMRYEISITNTDIEFSDISNIPENLKNISLKKNENILSFSCGMFF